jgi:hypothetical protein
VVGSGVFMRVCGYAIALRSNFMFGNASYMVLRQLFSVHVPISRKRPVQF